MIVQKDSNLKMGAVIVPATNERQATPQIVPERFNSTSRPSEVPIVSPELNSVSEPQVSQQTAFTR